MNMARINSISHKFYSVIYLLIITIIGVVCALNATYDVMIGGTPFYFLLLWCLHFRVFLHCVNLKEVVI